MIKAAVLVVLTALCCWILFRFALRVEAVHQTNTGILSRFQHSAGWKYTNAVYKHKKPEAMTHVNFTTSGVALTDPK